MPLAAIHEGELRSAAAAAALQAYAPYSGFRVGAALLLENGAVVTGCNVENACYRLGTCAEQGAIARAVAQHGHGMRIVAVAVANENPAVACTPCGGCRQAIAEFAGTDARIFYPAEGGAPVACSLGELLPAVFTLDRPTSV